MKTAILFSVTCLLSYPICSFADRVAEPSSSFEENRAALPGKVLLTQFSDTCTTKLRVSQGHVEKILSCKLSQRAEVDEKCKCRIPGTQAFASGTLSAQSTIPLKMASLQSLERQNLITACMKLYYTAPMLGSDLRPIPPGPMSDYKLRLLCMHQVDSSL
jgi:hypothetical protein